ncbi:MAG: TIGR02147 family protein [Bacteriovorax sp.]|nr:TIGR02147 family protein [Bacteriovorax sp.]
MTIYEFIDPIEFVNRQFSLKKELNPRFSLRSYAKVLGYENPSLLSSVLKGERKLGPELAEKIAIQLNLTPVEQKYFQLLILIKYSKNSTEKMMYTDLLEQTKPEVVISQFSVSIDSFRFIEDWYHLAILEMIELKDFKYDLGLMARRLGRGLNRELVESAVLRLIRLGLVEESKTKRYLKRKDGSFIIDKNIPSDSIKKHHDQFIQFARMAIFDQPIEERDVRSTTITLKKKNFKKAQDILKKAHTELLELSCSGDGDDVYQLCTQLFKLTNNLNEKSINSSGNTVQ